MSSKNARKPYTEDETLAKLKSAMAQSSGETKSDIRAAIKDRKKALRDK
jgi:hypothetical protein